jgi:hypothetical protein
MRIGTIYSASDKSLFDALNQKNVTNADLRELFLSRGILVSRETSRKSLALHFSRLNHDYHDYQKLAKLFGNPVHREKMESVRFSTDIALTTFEAGAHELKAELEAAGAVVKVYTAKGTRLDIEIKYPKVHFNKSDFRQVVSRTALISFERDGADVVVHAPHSDDVREWVANISKHASEKSGEKLELDEITLPPGMDPKARSTFFTHLVKEMKGYALHDVSDVYVSKPKPAAADDDDEPEVGTPGIHISKASLRGQGVFQSDELKVLSSKGFYISRIVWTAKGPALNSDIYEFEAQFSNADECRDFTYLPRGYYRYLEAQAHNQTRTAFSREEEHRFGVLIEAAARATLKKLPGAGLHA